MVSYRALKRQFGLDDEYLEDLKAEIIEIHQLAIEQDGTMLVWTGDASATSESASLIKPRPPDAERRQPTMMFCDLVDLTPL
jgi:hypothetical protein